MVWGRAKNKRVAGKTSRNSAHPLDNPNGGRYIYCHGVCAHPLYPVPQQYEIRCRRKKPRTPGHRARAERKHIKAKQEYERILNSKEGQMPIITIQMAKGRTEDQKQKLTAKLTTLIAKELEVKRNWITIIFQEYDRNQWATDGVLHSIKYKKK
jgi:4-oxalocrotonate tautomerase